MSMETENSAARNQERRCAHDAGKKAPPRRKRSLAGLLVLLLLAGTLAGVTHWREDRRCLLAADRLFEEGRYLGARAYYLRAGKDERAALCLEYDLERQYLSGRRSLEAGDYDKARRQLERIRGYKDSENLLRSCDYLESAQTMADGELEQAWDAFTAMGRYPGVDEKLKELEPRLYDAAWELALGGEYERAAAIWERLGGYRDCALLRKSAERMTMWRLSAASRLTDAKNKWLDNESVRVFRCDAAYLVTPLEPNRDTRFLLYYPGGRDKELYIDYFLAYLGNPEPNTVCVFLRRNGVDDAEAKNTEGIELMERTAAECGVFVHDLVVAGSSLGVYPALKSPIYSLLDFGLKTRCVLCLDAGNDWDEAELTLSMDQCYELAATGAELYLFDSPWVGMDRPAIRMMVEAGCPVTMVGCVNDDHAYITFDAMGMGVMHWALGDRAQPYDSPLYSFRRLRPGDAW